MNKINIIAYILLMSHAACAVRNCDSMPDQIDIGNFLNALVLIKKEAKNNSSIAKIAIDQLRKSHNDQNYQIGNVAIKKYLAKKKLLDKNGNKIHPRFRNIIDTSYFE